jgi:hypothetical protein
MHRPQLEILSEDQPHGLSLDRIDDERTGRQVGRRIVAKRQGAAHPHALLLGGHELVADALAGDLTLELGEGQQDVQGQPPHRGGGVEGLGHRHERGALGVEDLDDLGEVGQRPGQAVDLIDHHGVDPPRRHVRQQPAQRGPFDVAAREAAVVIEVG